MIKIFMGGGTVVVDGVEDNSERCLQWGSGGPFRNFPQKNLKGSG